MIGKMNVSIDPNLEKTANNQTCKHELTISRLRQVRRKQ